LIKESPNSFETVSIQARWLAATGHRDEAAPLVEAFLKQRLSEAKAKTDSAQALLAVGNLYDQVGLDAAAERCYRDLANHTPNGYVQLANWLARHQRIDDAISMCIQAAASDTSIVPAVTLARALIAGNASREAVERAEPLLSQAIASHADAPDLLFAVATMRLLNGRRDEAVSMLRKVLNLEPKNFLVRNNLASLLAERSEGRQEALKLIDEAIDIGGQSVELLDTKGMILLRDDKVSDAIVLLRDAAFRPPSDPRHLFHLSLAYQKAGKLDEATKTLRRARERSLTTTLLSPDERELLPQLERDLGL
jgi:tetratricopeptide (TPR) repeat protein